MMVVRQPKAAGGGGSAGAAPAVKVFDAYAAGDNPTSFDVDSDEEQAESEEYQLAAARRTVMLEQPPSSGSDGEGAEGEEELVFNSDAAARALRGPADHTSAPTRLEADEKVAVREYRRFVAKERAWRRRRAAEVAKVGRCTHPPPPWRVPHPCHRRRTPRARRIITGCAAARRRRARDRKRR